jgi:hypothetical protein
MDQIEFNIILRKPIYPVIIISAEKLYSAFNIKQLAKCCISSVPIEEKTIIPVIDSTGEEFWYSPEKYVLSPGFSFKRWTKKKLIESFNCSSNAQNSLQKYSVKSLSSKRLEKIVSDICELIRA